RRRTRSRELPGHRWIHSAERTGRPQYSVPACPDRAGWLRSGCHCTQREDLLSAGFLQGEKRAVSTPHHIRVLLTDMKPLPDCDATLHQVDEQHDQKSNDHQADENADCVASGLERIGMRRELMDLLIREHVQPCHSIVGGKSVVL